MAELKNVTRLHVLIAKEKAHRASPKAGPVIEILVGFDRFIVWDEFGCFRNEDSSQPSFPG